ncbi:MAG: GIY-YIG nuclease family protein [Bosea sp.]|uniref:GIY-YIG nuclease family protein n=1 Tax=Bosea sp. (in: a-proteobacteria) TaxID=1871050 RepID=UPI001AD5BA17|nr:GIY-YIG nuclease family protein [Bosea sp. (in: a-proteobacteria)]MBN9467468.1 GIY-YIG nuclease family protein [Bosea sp. (in: a-proteobacteria)]
MLTEDRKAAVAAYKERKVVAGIYLVRCGATGACWAGQAPDLSTIKNRVWFTLRHGSHRQRSLQAAWNAHGEGAFSFEEIERLDEKALEAGRERVMKARLAHWCAELGADGL